jgi:hypothetical protein
MSAGDRQWLACPKCGSADFTTTDYGHTSQDTKLYLDEDGELNIEWGEQSDEETYRLETECARCHWRCGFEELVAS